MKEVVGDKIRVNIAMVDVSSENMRKVFGAMA